jgi:hypothetical protein
MRMTCMLAQNFAVSLSTMHGNESDSVLKRTIASAE